MKNIYILASVVSFSALAVQLPASAACEEEIKQTLVMPQTAREAKQNEAYRRAAEKDDFDGIIGLAATAHLEDDPSSPGQHRYYSDKFPLSACILTKISNVHFKNMAAYAREGYALKLLAGDGVEKNVAEGIVYLQRAAESNNYGSAALRLGKLYLEGRLTPRDTGKAIYFLELAVRLAPQTPGGSLNPMDARGMLFDLYLNDRQRPRDINAAILLYKSIRSSKVLDDGLLRSVAAKEPAIAQAELKLVEEENSRTQQTQDRRQQRIAECERKNQFKGYSATVKCQMIL